MYYICGVDIYTQRKKHTMTIHKTKLGDSTFYINKTREGLYNYNRVNEKINKTFHYETALKYYKALKKAK